MVLSNEDKEEIKKQQEDPRIHNWYKFPRKARDLVMFAGLIGLGIGLLLFIPLFEVKYNPFFRTHTEFHQDFILEHGTCEQYKLLLEKNDEFSHYFESSLLVRYLVNCE